MKRALLASYEKDQNLLDLANLLRSHEWSLLGSAGTAKFLGEHGIPCRDVAEIVGPPILEHRVVTLARKIHAALLSTPNDTAELERLGVRPFGIVYVTLYPLEQTIKNGGSPEEVIEKTDIGGPTLLRAAAKGRRLVLSSPGQIAELKKWFDEGERAADKERLITKFVAAAERRSAEYIASSAEYWEKHLDYEG